MDNEKLFEIISKMYGEMQEGFKNIDEKLKNTDERIARLENVVTNIEDDHGNKLSALLDGYKQNASRLDRIEKEVTRHDDFILKRIK